ncbi:MAG TPA: response regulator [Dongiaceae bacterium]|nr:response regulator [Dongiaceae bacterium]
MNDNTRVNILMVDDQPAKLLSYEAILSDLGENLIQATSGREALEHLLKTDVALVLMDVSMPELDGFELADIIRQHPRFQHTAILFISAVHLTDLDRLKGYQLGAVDYISVPVVPELLKAKVSVFAELHRKRQQLEALNQELRVLSGRLLTLQDDERRRFARELHDGLGQDLVAVKMIVDAMGDPHLFETREQSAVQASQLIDRTLKQVRSISHLLHPPLLDEGGLHSALRCYVDGLAQRSEIRTSLQLHPPDFPRLPAELETTIFRIIQEALTNIFRHSEARNALVSVSMERNQVVISVRDDGKGVSDEIVGLRPGSLGVGIGGMRQRAKEFGGELRMQNLRPGTLVEVLVPLWSDGAPPNASQYSVVGTVSLLKKHA